MLDSWMFCGNADIIGQFCLRIDRCESGWKKINKTCFLPVYDKMTWYGAFAHCKRLNSTLSKEKLPGNLFVNDTRNIVSSSFWIGNRYQTITDTEQTNWMWLNGSLFNEWSRWNVIITDIGCGGCGFWRNGIIHLTSKCSENASYFCGSDWVGK